MGFLIVRPLVDRSLIKRNVPELVESSYFFFEIKKPMLRSRTLFQGVAYLFISTCISPNNLRS